MVSVCLAVKNGEAYLREQLDSILTQLTTHDEVVISDDRSIDRTCEIANSYADARIKIVESPKSGIIANFENSLARARGDFLFLADQDDVWLPRRILIMKEALQASDLVVSNCAITDEDLRVQVSSFFEVNRSGPGVYKNLIKNSYMGCCMALRRRVLDKALPFPIGLPVHDLWLGLIAESFFNVTFIDDVLLLHRKHSKNATTTGFKSKYSLSSRMEYRFRVLNNLIQLKYA